MRTRADYFQDELNSINARNGKITLYCRIGADPSNATAQIWRVAGA